MLYFVMRPSSLSEPDPVFTRHLGLSKSLAGCTHRAKLCGGRVYGTDGHQSVLQADFYVAPMPAPVLTGKAYWQARNQVAVFA